VKKKDRSFLQRFIVSLGISGFSISLVCMLLGWHAVKQIAAINAAPSRNEAALSLRSKAIEPGSSALGNLSPTAVLIVAGVLATLVFANAISEASKDSFLCEVKRQFGSVQVDHLFLPVDIETKEHEVSSSFLVRLDNHYATFLATQHLANGKKVTFHSKTDSNRNSVEHPRFHGTVSNSKQDDGSSFFEIEIHLHAKNDAERNNLTNWITSLQPSDITT
jgi:hypothetical protein